VKAGMDWLSKAGDLLDKVDQLAAERLLADEGVDDDEVLALLDEAEADSNSTPEPVSASRSSQQPMSPRTELQGYDVPPLYCWNVAFCLCM
jgi:hypothetical protein